MGRFEYFRQHFTHRQFIQLNFPIFYRYVNLRDQTESIQLRDMARPER